MVRGLRRHVDQDVVRAELVLIRVDFLLSRHAVCPFKIRSYGSSLLKDGCLLASPCRVRRLCLLSFLNNLAHAVIGFRWGLLRAWSCLALLGPLCRFSRCELDFYLLGGSYFISRINDFFLTLHLFFFCLVASIIITLFNSIALITISIVFVIESNLLLDEVSRNDDRLKRV